MRGEKFSHMMEAIQDFRVNRFHFPAMLISKYVRIRFTIYLGNLLLSKIILTIAKFGMKNALYKRNRVFV